MGTELSTTSDAPTKKKFLSATALDVFETCERKYFYERILGYYQPMNHYLVVGDVYHQCIADALVHGWADRERIDATLHESAQRIMAVGVNFQGLATEILENMQRLEPIAQKLGEPTREPEWRWEWEEEGWRGIIDLLTDQIVDWKILSGKRRRSERDAQMSPQLALYCLFTGKERASFVEVPRDHRKIQVRTMHMDERQRGHWLHYFRSMRDAIWSRGTERTAYKRTQRSNPRCSPMWCEHYGRCYPLD